MKKLHYIAMSLLPLLGQAQTAQVHIAGTAYPVIFADTNLLFAVHQRIASDLTVCFSPASSFDDAAGTEKEEGVYPPNLFHTMFPCEEMCDGFSLVDYDNQKSVRVSRVASSNYLHAFTLMEAHSNAVQKLQDFIVALKDPNLPAGPLQALKDLHNSTPEDRAEAFSDSDYREFVRGLQANRILGSCALAFTVQPCPELGNAEIPMTVLFTAHRSDPSFAIGLPILFHNGRWGFGKYW